MIKAITIFFLFFSSAAFAQTDSVSAIAETESGQIGSIDTLLKLGDMELDPDSLSAIRGEKAYGYMRNLDSLLKVSNSDPGSETSGPSFLERILFSPVMRFLFWIVAIAGILFILYRLVSTGGSFFKKRKPGMVEIPGEDLSDHEARDFIGLYHQAVRNGQFRLATRYIFLQTLVRLGDAEAITIAPGKTNMHYLSEIKPELKPDFRKLVNRYEYIWYGQHDIEKQDFDDLANQFQKFNDHIS